VSVKEWIRKIGVTRLTRCACVRSQSVWDLCKLLISNDLCLRLWPHRFTWF